MIEVPEIHIITETAEEAAERMLDDPNATPQQIAYRERVGTVIANASLGFKDNLDEFYTKMRKARIAGAVSAAQRGEFTLSARRILHVGSKQFPLPPKVIGSYIDYLINIF